VIRRVLSLTSRWSGSLAAAVGDQALISGAHLVLQVVLARRLTPEGYGSFAVAFAGLLFAVGFHGAVVAEPMSVLGARRDPADRGPYLGTVARLHFLLALPASAAVAALASLPGLAAGSVRSATLSLAAGLPVILLFWLVRAACYLEARPWLALRGSAVYAITLVGLLGARIALAPGGALGAPESFLLMAGASVAACAVLWRPLGLRRPHPGTTRPLLAEHWTYGKWILAATFANAVGTLLVTPLLAALAGLAQSGAFRALQNLTSPLQQGLAGVGTLALPQLSRRSSTSGAHAFRRAAIAFVGASGAAAAVYGLALWAIGPWLLDVLYRSAFYRSTASLLPLVAGTVVAAALGQALGIAHRAAGRPDAVMWAKGAAAAAFLGVGWPAIGLRGLEGALYALLAGALAEAVVLGTLWLRRERPDRPDQPCAANTPTSSGSITPP
jgi:O-antigen/teichoic acid export membrane protein